MSKTSARSEKETKEILSTAVLEAAAEKTPAWARPIIMNGGVAFNAACTLLDALEPFFRQAYTYAMAAYEKSLPYKPHLLIPIVTGVVMMFFGGSFMMIISCIEAYRICGWDGTRKGITALYHSYLGLRDANKKDDERDDNNDGIPDVRQISKNELITRKIKVFLTNCNPAQLQEALAGIYTGFIAVLATLRAQFARTIALGNSIADVVHSHLNKYVEPTLKRIVPAEYHQWIPVFVSYTFRTAGLSLAYFVTRVLFAVQSALKGAQLVLNAWAAYCKEMGKEELSSGIWDDVAVVVLSVAGMYVQLFYGFGLPSLLGLLLFPAVWAETILQWMVAYH